MSSDENKEDPRNSQERQRRHVTTVFLLHGEKSMLSDRQEFNELGPGSREANTRAKSAITQVKASTPTPSHQKHLMGF